jgi:hypothetical protein
MHDAAERGRVANAFADRVGHGYSQPDTDKLTDSVPYADLAPVDRSAERAVGHGRVGTGRRNAPLPLV